MFCSFARPFSFSVLTFTLFIFSLSGCGENVPSGQVAGTLKIKGAPAKAGTVVRFMTAEGTNATGVVGDGGAYVLKVNGAPSPEQIPTGSYKISISSASNAPAMTDEEYEKMMNSGAKLPETKKDSSIPTKYASGQTSGLSFEVKTGPNTCDLNIE